MSKNKKRFLKPLALAALAVAAAAFVKALNDAAEHGMQLAKAKATAKRAIKSKVALTKKKVAKRLLKRT